MENRAAMISRTVAACCQRHAVQVSDLARGHRWSEVVAARHEIIRALHAAGMAASEIARVPTIGIGRTGVLSVLSRGGG